MLKHRLYLLLAFTFPFFTTIAEEKGDPLALIDFGQQNKAHPLLPITEGDNGTVVAGCVNIITGQYIDSSIDLSLESLEPLSIHRSYSSKTDGTLYYPPHLEGGPNAYLWYINANTLLLLDKKKGSWAGLGELGGGNFSYKCKENSSHYDFDFFANKGVTNSGSGLLSGQTNFRNFVVDFNGRSGFYEARTGDGTCRHYKATSFSPNYRDLGVNFLHWERKASGNLITYEYNNEGRLIECRSTTPQSNKIFSKLCYNWMDGNGFTITGDERRSIHYAVRKLQTKGRAQAYVIDKVNYPNGLELRYFYNNGDENLYFCTGKELSNQRVQRVEYYHSGNNKVGENDRWLSRDDSRLHKVKLIAAPTGASSHPNITHRFFYHKNATEVINAQNNLTRITYDDEKRVTGIEKFYSNGSRFSFERNIWGTDKNFGNLMAKVLEDGQGRPYFARLFEYDERGNVIVEKLLGNLTGECRQTIQYHSDGAIVENGIEAYIKKYTYTNDGFNLLRMEIDGEKITHYGYVPGTNLLACKLIDDTQKIRQREFRFYNEDSALIKKVEDDGSSTDCENLIDVNERRITYFHPRKDNPGLGLPEKVEERYLDISRGEERSLKTYVNHYNGLGKIDEQIVFDANGKFAYREINTYDIMGHIVEEIDPLNQKTTYTYDLNGNLIKKNGAFETVYAYDYADRLISETVIDPSGERRMKHFSYDLVSNRILEQDSLGNETHYTYDEFQRVIKITLPSILDEKGERISHSISKGYDVANHLVDETDGCGERKQTRYNIRGQPVEHGYLGHNSDHMIYDLQGNLIKTVSKKGAITTFKYDYLRRLTEKTLTSPQGELVGSESYEYDAFHLRKKVDLNGLIHLFFYDGAGRESIVLSGDRKMTKEYDSLGHVAAMHQWVGEDERITCRYNYDVKDRLIEESVESNNGVEKRIGYVYDTYGNRSQEIHYPENQPAITTTLYDVFKRPRMVIDPLGHQTRYFYDQVINEGNQRVDQITVINAEGVKTVQRLNALGFVEEVVQQDPLGKMIAKERAYYDGKGRKITEIITVIGGKNEREIVNRFTYSYDKLIEQIEEGEKHTRYNYNPNGELIEKSSPRSKIVYQYDLFGRLISQRAFSPNESDDESTFEYDVSGQLTKVTHNGKETLRSYNLFSEMESETQESDLKVEYRYDSLGRRVALKLPDGSLIKYSYSGSRLHKIERGNNLDESLYSHTYTSFDWEGNVKESIALTGLKISSFYDLLGRQIAIKSDAWKECNIIYDSLGNAVKLTTHDGGGKVNSHFSYNALSQLIQERGLATNAYAYDSTHNRLSKNQRAYQMGTCNKLLSTETEQFEWDEEGNLLKRYGQQEIHFSYDSLGHLRSYKIDQKADQVEYHYSYDSFDRRIAKRVDGYSPIYYLYDGENEIGLVDERGTILELRVLGLSRGAEIGAAVAVELDNNLYVPLHDHRGNVCCLIDKEGSITENYRYSAFGEVSVIDTQGSPLEASQVENPWLFSSKRQDMESNLIFFGRRYYDSSLGRWITPDPKGFHDGSNLYAFVRNNPLTLFDLYGLRTEGNTSQTSGRSFLSSIWDRLVSAVRGAGSVVEWVGKNLIPVPGIRDGVEAIGRWTAGGKLFQRAEYHSCNSKIMHIPGRTVPGHSYTHGNGMLTNKTDAIKQAEYVSKTHGDIQVDLLFHGTEGLVMDLIGCGLAKLGMPTSYNKMCANYYQSKLQEDHNHRFTSSVHSRGGIQIMNTGRFLSPEQRKHIDVISYGSATLIPRGYFRDAENYLSGLDIVTMTNPLAYGVGLISNKQYNMHFLSPATRCPVKAHGFLEATYTEEIARKGYDFKKEYFNE